MNKKLLIVCLSLIFLVLLSIFLLFQKKKYLKVVILDVGQGSGAYIKSPEGYEILLDSGETNKTLRSLSKFRPVWDRHINLLVGSHPDKDHIGMFPEIIKRYVVDGYVHSGKQGGAGPQQVILELLEQKNIPELLFDAGSRIELSRGLLLTVLHPDLSETQDLSDNEGSLVILLEYGSRKFLFMGDVSEKIERELIRRYGELLDVDVLVLGHHGSKTSSSEEFLRHTTPLYGVISSGLDNRYGHPHDVVLDHLQREGIGILRTDEVGNIQFLVNKDGDFDIMSK